jgi:hypothetical protein
VELSLIYGIDPRVILGLEPELLATMRAVAEERRG